MEYINLSGLANFGAYFSTALISLLAFKYIVLWITPYNEWKLIKENKNISAGIALGGSLVGFSIAVNGVLQNAVNYIDFGVWVTVALITQVMSIMIVRFGLMPKFVERIENDEKGPAIVAACLYISVGLLNAGSMTY